MTDKPLDIVDLPLQVEKHDFREYANTTATALVPEFSSNHLANHVPTANCQRPVRDFTPAFGLPVVDERLHSASCPT